MRGSLPTNRVGGGVTVRCAGLLPFDIEPVMEQVITGSFLSGPNGKTAVRVTDRPLTVLTQRRRLDALLVEQAPERSVEFRDGTPVKELFWTPDGYRLRLADGSEVRSRVVVGEANQPRSQSPGGPHHIGLARAPR